MLNTIQNTIHQAMVSQFNLEDAPSIVTVKHNEDSGGYACKIQIGSKTAFMGEIILIGSGYLDDSNSQLSSQAKEALYSCLIDLVRHAKKFNSTEERAIAIQEYIKTELIN